MVSTKDIVQARERIGQLVAKTPCSPSAFFDEVTGAKTFLKFENLQMTGSFKERGAANKLLSLTPEERARGAITASAGNHAQGVAYHAARLGIPATIVMPRHTPLIKVSRTRELGARVVLAGSNFDEAYAEACRIQEEEGQTFVHPFDDPAVIAGQGTIGLELLEQEPDHRRLPRARGADEEDELPLLDHERDAFERGHVRLVDLRHVLEDDHGSGPCGRGRGRLSVAFGEGGRRVSGEVEFLHRV